ncbi:MAG: 23S rRNA (guanosine(2251)-2'-O)-methyltransferase RlmB [Clostridia bacterium]|nr:23S rRNA (guanosine(2251)-2'-O)-methyltransferase RlmB [Clostridia bacterium]
MENEIFEKNSSEEKSDDIQIICGRNAVFEAVRSGREIDRLLVAHSVSGGSVSAIIAKAKQAGILIKEVSPQKLDFLCGGANHQGVAVQFASQRYAEVEDILRKAEESGRPPFIIICDEVEDPHNLGAIIRTAECCGAHGIIIPKRRSASLNATVAKSASGALEYMPVARVTNIAVVIEKLKDKGIWVFGADMNGKPYTDFDYNMPCAIVIGNEGKGIGPLVAKKCDEMISLPMFGQINSLNASVAAGVLMYEVVRKRSMNFGGAK